MARRRRTATRRRSTSRRSAITFQVKSSVLREIWAVIYLGLAFITFLSLRQSFGPVGEMWVSFLKPVLGWGIWILPVFFLGCSLTLFLSKKVSFPFSKMVGIFFFMVSVLSILHLSVPMDAIYTAAQAGSYGGYVGFVTNFLLLQILNVGQIGATVVFILMLAISVLLTFEISLARLFAFLKPDIRIIRTTEDVKKPKAVEEDIAVKEEEDADENMDEDIENETNMIKINRMHISPTVSTPNVDRVVSIRDRSDEEDIKEEDDEKNGEALVDKDEDDGYEWVSPPLDVLNAAVADVGTDDALLMDNAEIIRNKLSQFGIEVVMHEVHVGPTVIQYTLRPHEGIKLSKITALKNDLALALAAEAIRIEAPIPGKSLVGIEVPNDHRSLVRLREIMESKEYGEIDSMLRLPLGRDVSGKPMCGDLESMPHLLIAGATGAGKSVGMNTFLISLLYQNSPASLRLILIDPKRVELNSYNGIPHLLTPVITDPGKAAIALRWAVAEMNRRYQLLAENKHRNIADFNNCDEVHEEGRELPGHQKMPNIVIVIDELADLMMAAGKEVEASICRVAQMARAVGIHLVVATQRPSVDVITGLIKANIPARIAFAVSSSVDSRTILDSIGAEDLLGKGDMLYLPGGMSKPVRIQGIYISSKEIERVTNHIKIAGAPSYIEDVISPRIAQERIQGIPESSFAEDEGDEEGNDNLYEQALQIVTESRKASASLLQRRLKVGYARAARLLDMMEKKGVIGPVNGAKAREIYVNQ